MANILICDDERDIVNALNIYLSAAQHTIFEAFDGQQALDVLEKEDIQLVLMDVMMPRMDGLTATAAIRRVSNVPIILITAKSEDGDKVLGLDVGADDYITKPFSPVEVQARVRSHLRRYTRLGGADVGTGAAEGRLTVGGVELDDSAKAVTVDGDPVSLTPIEYNLLKLLMSHPGQVFSSAEIYRRVWNETPLGSEGAVAVHIRHLREKIEAVPGQPRYLKVVWGHGYKMEGGK